MSFLILESKTRLMAFCWSFLFNFNAIDRIFRIDKFKFNAARDFFLVHCSYLIYSFYAQTGGYKTACITLFVGLFDMINTFAGAQRCRPCTDSSTVFFIFNNSELHRLRLKFKIYCILYELNLYSLKNYENGEHLSHAAFNRIVKWV